MKKLLLIALSVGIVTNISVHSTQNTTLNKTEISKHGRNFQDRKFVSGAELQRFYRHFKPEDAKKVKSVFSYYLRDRQSFQWLKSMVHEPYYCGVMDGPKNYCTREIYNRFTSQLEKKQEIWGKALRCYSEKLTPEHFIEAIKAIDQVILEKGIYQYCNKGRELENGKYVIEPYEYPIPKVESYQYYDKNRVLPQGTTEYEVKFYYTARGQELSFFQKQNEMLY